MRGTGRQTVIMGMEDGPSTPDSQMWMHVGRKDRSARGNVLRRNGLEDGTLHVLRAVSPNVRTEGDFKSGSIRCEWVAIPNAASMNDSALEAAADAAGAFGFVRVEDGAFNPNEKDEFLFVTTGSSWTPAGAPLPANKLGRLYLLKLDKKDVTAPCELQVVYNADDVIAAGGDIAISPDNMDVSSSAVVIQEDGTSESRPVMGSKGRDGSIWSFPLTGAAWQQRVDVAGRSRIAEVDPPGRDGIAVGPGVWESSGIIDASDILGDGCWIVNVQAHRPTTAPAPNTVEDGQVLWIRPN
jgi:secreted PhoX family phosphatase